MKATLLVLIVCLSTTIIAQNSKAWEISRVDFKVQVLATQSVEGMTYQSILNASKDPSKVSIDMTDYQLQNNYGYESDVFNLHISAHKLIKNNLYHEIGIGAGLHDYGEFLVDYQPEFTNMSSPSLGWCRLQDRYEINASYFLKYGNNVLNMRIGPIFSYANSFFDQVLVIDYSEGADEFITQTDASHNEYFFGILEFQIGLNAYRGISPFIGYRYGIGTEIGQSARLSTNGIVFGMSYEFNN